MPTHAVLGATGNVGTSIIKVLLETPSDTIRAFCRSKEKLVGLIPEAADIGRIQVFEGDIDDHDTLVDCLRGTDVAFLAVAIKSNAPGTTIATDTAKAVAKTLDELRSNHPEEGMPRLVVLSSASTEHRLMDYQPKFLLNFLYACNCYIYKDLEEAEGILRSAPVSTTFIKPGALSDDERKGHVLDLDTARYPVSFIDLAAGMVEVAKDTGGTYAGKSVAVNPVGSVRPPLESAPLLLRGFVSYLAPWSWRYIGVSG